MDNDKQAEELREEFERERIAVLKQEQTNKDVLKSMHATLRVLRYAKPTDRNELARRYAVAITEYEKLLAYFKVYVVD